ncbi:MAG: hypothetical protein U0X20_18345 [Caldilineaceae bacterium]
MPYSKFSRACLAWFFGLWLAVAPAAALAPQVALAAPGTEAAPVIQVSTESAAIGEWIDVTLENGPAGHQGYFTADAPLTYAAPDGTPQAYPYQVVIDPGGRAAVRVSAASAGYRLLTFEDTTGGSALPVMHLVQFTNRMLPGIRPDILTSQGEQDGADKPFAFIYAWRYPPGGYLKGVPTLNRITVNYNLQGQAGDVLLLANNKVIDSVAANGAGSHVFTVDMGSDNFSIVNELRAAVEVKRQRSELSKEFFFTQLPGANLINGLKNVKPFAVQGEGNDTRFVAEVEFPGSGMLYSSPGFISTDAVKQTLHIAQLKGSLILPVLCNQSGRFVELTGETSYASTTKVWVVPLEGSISARGRLAGLQRDCNVLALQLDGTIDTKAQLSGGKQWEMRDFYQDVLGPYFPTLANALGLTSYGKIGFQALLAASALANASLVAYPPYFTAKVGLEADLDLKGKLDEWVPLIWWLTMDLSKTGGRLIYNSDVRSSEFQKLYAYASYGYHTDIWFGWVWGGKIYSASLDGACAYDPQNKTPTKCEASAGAGSDVAVAPPANAVRYGGTSPVQAAGAWSWASGTPQAIMNDIYPLTQPSLAVNPDTGDALLLWDHDDLARPWGQSAEILSRHWDGANWSEATAITADAGLDMHPQVAWTAGGKAVAVWEHVTGALPDTGAAAADTLGFEIATAVYDAAGDSWSTPTLLTSNAAFDGGVRLARNAAGQLMAAWVESDAGVEPTGGPAQIMTAFYDGGWDAPVVAVPQIDAQVALAVGCGSGRAAVAFTQIMTPAGGTEPMSQILFSEWDGSAWSQPVPVAPAAEEQHDPNVVYNAQNQALVAYVNSYLHLRNMATGAAADLELDPAVMDLGRLMVAQDGDGNLLAVFRNQFAGDFDLYTARFDVRTGRWSPPRRLIADDSESRSVAVAADGSGALRAAYVATAYTEEPSTLTFLDGSTMPTTQAVARGTGLNVLGYTYRRELTLPEGGLVVSDLHPQPGATVILSGTVQNTGDLPETAVSLRFYDGDPNAGGVLIADVPLPELLSAGESATVATPYWVPLGSPIRTFFVTAHRATTVAVQGAENIQDPQASAQAFGPDWVLTSAVVLPDQAGVALLRATIQNMGTQASPLSALRIFRDDVNNPPLVEVPLPILQPGETYTVTEPWHVGVASPQSMQLIVQVGNPAEELDTADSMAALQLPVGPDLALTPFNIDPGDLGEHQVPITVTVYNLGPVTAGDVEVQLHREWRRGSGDLIGQAAVGPIGPGEAATAVLTVEGPLTCGVYASVIAGGDIASANNYASIAGTGPCAERIYLPKVSR